MDKLRGLRWYLILVILGFSFFAYSQLIGWRWVGATRTEPPANNPQQQGYRYYNHK